MMHAEGYAKKIMSNMAVALGGLFLLLLLIILSIYKATKVTDSRSAANPITHNLELPVGKPVKIQMDQVKWSKWIMPEGKAVKGEIWCPAGCEIVGWNGEYLKMIPGGNYPKGPDWPFRLRGMGTAEVTFR
jgi:hypothetical protein